MTTELGWIQSKWYKLTDRFTLHIAAAAASTCMLKQWAALRCIRSNAAPDCDHLVQNLAGQQAAAAGGGGSGGRGGGETQSVKEEKTERMAGLE